MVSIKRPSRNGDISIRGKRGPSVYLVLSLRHFLHRHQVRHLPSNMTPIWKCDYAADDSRTGGIPERLQEAWYLRGTRSSDLPYIPHVDSAISSSGVDLAPIWGPASLRSER